MSEIQSLARGLKILELLSHAVDGMSITELAGELGVDKASASRLAATLVHYGFAEKNPGTRRFQLGPQLIRLGRSRLERPLNEAARPFLHLLMENSGECAHLAVLAQGRALYIAQVESPATLRVNAQVGQMSPLHCTALGKVLLAFGEVELPAERARRTDNTITGAEELSQHLKQVVRQGYAVDDEEYDLGVRCIAAPVYDFTGKLAGSIGISGPAMRMPPGKIPGLAQLVMDTARGLSEQLHLYG